MPLDDTQGAALAALPLYFIENQGQVDERVALYVQGRDKSIYFTPQGLTFVLTEAGRQVDRETARQGNGKAEKLGSTDARYALQLDFVGANPSVQPQGQAQTEAIVSYFKGRPSQWKTGLPTYNEVVYKELWPGIDLVYTGRQNHLKYTFLVKPGADPSQIKLAYRGATSVQINTLGQLEVSTPGGGFHDAAPVSHQEIDGQQVEVATKYTLTTDNTNAVSAAGSFSYSFDVAAYDPRYPLVIDPTIFIYAGFIGGSGSDTGQGVAVDSAGNAYVAGGTQSAQMTFPDGDPDNDNVFEVPGFDQTYNGVFDAFVAKVNAAGTALIYATYIGGSGYDYGNDIAVDGNNNAYVVGHTASNQATFPVNVGPDLTFNGVGDAFVAKLNVAGTALVYAGYIGGNVSDTGDSIAVDRHGKAYVVGTAASTQATFPDGNGFGGLPSFDQTYNGGGNDAFAAKVNQSGSGLMYAGYIGGNADDFGYGVAVDDGSDGVNAYVTGSAGSTEATFPDGDPDNDNMFEVPGPDQTYNGGSDDAFVAKVNPMGTALVYAGYIGGAEPEAGLDIALDSSTNAYVVGPTRSPEDSFPDGDGFGLLTGPDMTYNGDVYDAFVAKVNPTGTALVYAGYIGGVGYDYGASIAVGSNGLVSITGWTNSTEDSFPDGDGFGTLTGPDVTFNGGMYDAFVARINVAGTALNFASYIGGSGDDRGRGITVDGGRNAYIVGQTASTEATFPDGDPDNDNMFEVPGPDQTYNGGSADAFVVKIGPQN